MYRFDRALPVTCLLLFAGFAQADIITNGGFEFAGGSLTGWGGISAGGSGWYLQSGATAPVNAFSVPLPPEGSYAAMTDGTAPGVATLSQFFTVPANALAVTISFEYFVLNPASASGTYTIPSPDSLDYTGDPVQEARVDLFSQSADLLSTLTVTTAGGLIENLFETQPGDSNGTQDNLSYSLFSADITSVVTPGGTYQIRFAEANNLGPLVFGIDNVQIVTSGGVSPTVPEPATLLLCATGLLFAVYSSRRARIGSMRAARRAGIAQAASETTASRTATVV